MNTKKQLFYINGGMAKENYASYYDFLQGLEYSPYLKKFESWNKTLGKYLGDDWEYVRAPFREREYADYEAWKIMFEKMFPFMNDDIYLGASSLGGSFILKYFSENSGIKNTQTGKIVHIKKLFLIAAATHDTPHEVLGSFKPDLEKGCENLKTSCDKIYIYHSHDDHCVPFAQSLELQRYLPQAVFRKFDDRGHFYKEDRLLELEEDLES